MKRTAIDQITTYNSISEFLVSLGKLDVQDNDFSIRCLDGYLSDKPISSNSFRTNFFNFLMIVDGAGSYTIDNVSFELAPASFYFTTPGHLKSFVIEKPWKGFILSFTEKFIKEYYLGNLFKEFPFLVAETTPPIFLDETRKADIYNRLAVLLDHYQTKSQFKYQMITNMLIAFLYKVKEMLLEAPKLDGKQFGYSLLVIKFRKFLDDHFRDVINGKVPAIFNGSQIADALAVSADHLGSIVKKETGRTLTKWICERTVMEAQCMLKNSTLSISQIAYLLTFTDPTNFTKYFKKNTGYSPKEYRRK